MRAVILISGNGSNLQSLIDNARKIDLKICSVISNKEDAFGLKRAERASIRTHFVDPNLYESREGFDKQLITMIDELDISLIILAGYMRILSSEFINHFAGKILNIHPSLLPKFPGLNTHRKAIDAKEKYHGATVHFVTEELDGGPIISQEIVEIDFIDTEYSLSQKVLKKEHILYPRVIHWYTQNRLKLLNTECITLDGKIL
ncbi:phosphoribosylglycinamide formyltransferase [Candidatus Pseudothioglobus singularis]|jgi:phosphoribosylglycinamide formyltransferase 1|uniref:Phosphoribosylglycinamide formyltransferase n=1 Tax=Candidatus Pseudothioglobus singularis PS1 TaxID=1125411 RepID=A0A0M4M1V5_9GAMM|nr:phosphoribosylglycinamide formyltransferase [Candidatus Pseudothioglobus singularis]ALE01492.1 phosphoribosylglycinamide formyltransferase [Candidatus Pseudothioglobus singularis PS1]